MEPSFNGHPWIQADVFLQFIIEVTDTQPEKTPDISQERHWIPHNVTSEKRMQKFHTDDTIMIIHWLCCLEKFA